jgi:hypothetical protein
MERRILLSSISPGHPLRTRPLNEVPGITAFDTATQHYVDIRSCGFGTLCFDGLDPETVGRFTLECDDDGIPITLRAAFKELIHEVNPT